MTETAIYKGAPGTFVPGTPYIVTVGVSAAGYTVRYESHKPLVYRTLRAFSDNWDIQAKENTIKSNTVIPKLTSHE